MDILSYVKKEIVEKALKKGLILTPEALDYLVFSVKNVDEVLDRLARSGITTVRLEDITSEREEVIEVRKEEEKEGEESVERIGTIVEEPVGDCKHRIRVSLYADLDDLEPASWERDQERILRERLSFFESLFKQKGQSFVDYDRARRSGEERNVLGLIVKVDHTPSGKTIIYVEDGEETASIIHIGERDAERKIPYLDTDVVALFTVRSSDNGFFLRDIVLPGTAGYVPRISECPYRLLVVPNPFEKDLTSLPLDEVDGVAFVSNIIHVYRSPDPKEAYKVFDSFISSIERDVFVVPGLYDAVRSIPPHPAIDSSLLPESSSLENVFLLSSPSIVKINRRQVLFYSGEYYVHASMPLDGLLRTRLIQPDISSYPFRASKDFSLLRKVPDISIVPSNGRTYQVGDAIVIGRTSPYIVEISSGKVIALE